MGTSSVLQLLRLQNCSNMSLGEVNKCSLNEEDITVSSVEDEGKGTGQENRMSVEQRGVHCY